MFSNFQFENSKHLASFNHYTEFDLDFVPLCLANALRRTILSDIPIMAFNDSWNDNENKRSIVIKENTSSIHNEFLSHRIALTPLCMKYSSHHNDIFKITTNYNIQNNIRHFDFKNLNIPSFSINLENNKQTRELRGIQDDTENIIEVTNQDLQYIVNQESDLDDLPDLRDIILPDFYTGDYIILDILKPNSLDISRGEKLNIIAKPTIGTGSQNAIYSPVGTVSFKFNTDTKEKINEIFLKNIEYKNSERLEKGLKILSEEEESILQRSFNLLDKERVYKENLLGNPYSFHYEVESIGFLESNQIVLDALTILDLKILDILNSLEVNINDGNIIEIICTNNKLQYTRTADRLNGLLITISGENHTVGNLISEYLKLLYIGKNAFDTGILAFSSYKMPHPLKDSIEVKMKLFHELSNEENISKVYNHILNSVFGIINTQNKASLQIKEDIIYLTVFLNCLVSIHTDLNKLLTHWKYLSNIYTTSFEITDSPNFFSKHSQFNIIFKNITSMRGLGSNSALCNIVKDDSSNISAILVNPKVGSSKVSQLLESKSQEVVDSHPFVMSPVSKSQEVVDSSPFVMSPGPESLELAASTKESDSPIFNPNSNKYQSISPIGISSGEQVNTLQELLEKDSKQYSSPKVKSVMSSLSHAHKRLEKEGLKWIVRKDKLLDVKNDTDYPENLRTTLNPNSEVIPINYTLQDELVAVTSSISPNFTINVEKFLSHFYGSTPQRLKKASKSISSDKSSTKSSKKTVIIKKKKSNK